MKLVVACVLAVIFVILSGGAKADSLRLTWSHPESREDGSSLSIDEISSTSVIWNCDGKTGSKDIPAPVSEAIVGKPTDGMTCIYTLTTTAKDGGTSKPSESIKYIGTASQPMPPKWLEVKVEE